MCQTLQINQVTRKVHSIQFSSLAQSCPTLWDPMDCSMPGLPVHHQLPELAQTQVHQAGDAIQPSHPVLSPSPPAFNLFQHQGLFQGQSIRSFSFSISPTNEYSELVSFRIDCFDLLVVQGTLKSLHNYNSKASILWCPAFFMVQLLTAIHDYWRNHRFDQMDLCWQSDVSAF